MTGTNGYVRRFLILSSCHLVILSFLLGLLVGFLTAGCHLQAAQPETGKDKPKTAAEPFSPYAYLLSTDQAIHFFEERVQRDPKDCVNQTLLAEMYIRKAREAGHFASYERAGAAIGRALELDPAYVPAQVDRAILLSAKHRFAEALQLGQRIYQKNPG